MDERERNENLKKLQLTVTGMYLTIKAAEGCEDYGRAEQVRRDMAVSRATTELLLGEDKAKEVFDAAFGLYREIVLEERAKQNNL